MDKVSILGTEYKIETHKVSADEHMLKNNFMGYCWYDEKLIVIPDTTEKEYFMFADDVAEKNYINKVLRHEVVHALLYESGLAECCEWANNEMIIDWIALQCPKMMDIFKQLDCI